MSGRQKDLHIQFLVATLNTSSQITHTNRRTHRQTFSHPPAPALATGADVVAAPPSAAAAEASVAGTGVAKASEVYTNPSRK